MATTSTETACKPKRTKPHAIRSRAKAPQMPRNSPAVPVVPAKPDDQADTHVTKQDRVLGMLSRPQGASIVEMAQATDWQRHSVRGFLAGTVKKKLGLPLTSSKTTGEERRYRVEIKRGR